MALPLKPRRRTTKRFVWANIILAYGTLWACLAMAPEALQWLATPIMLLIVGIFGFYTGTGTADMFATLRNPSTPQRGGYVADRFPGEVADDHAG